MEALFNNDKAYAPSDPEMAIIGDTEKLKQWRHRNVGPAFYRLGRKIVYSGADLNAWVAANRVEPKAA